MSARLMIVDDEPDIRLLLATVLTEANYEIAEAENATQLTEAFSGRLREYHRFADGRPSCKTLKLRDRLTG